MSESVEKIIHTLYVKFMMWDLFARIVPGGLVLMVLFRTVDVGVPFSLTGEGSGVLGWLAMAGAAWMTGLVVGSVAAEFGVVRMHPPRHSETAARIHLRRYFMGQSSAEDRVLAERYAIVKEATGNAAAALLLSAILLLLGALGRGEIGTFLNAYWLGIFVLVLFSYAFRQVNMRSAEKEFELIRQVAGEGGKSEEAA